MICELKQFTFLGVLFFFISFLHELLIIVQIQHFWVKNDFICKNNENLKKSKQKSKKKKSLFFSHYFKALIPF